MSNVFVFDNIIESIKKREETLRSRAAMFRRYTSDKLWKDIENSIENKPKGSTSMGILKQWVEHWYFGFTALLDEIFNIGYGLLLREYQFETLVTGLKLEPILHLGATDTGYTAYYDKNVKEICLDSYAGLLSALNQKYKEKFRYGL